MNLSKRHEPTTAEDRLHPLLELTKVRLREFFRERGMIFWVFGFPILMAIGLGLAFRNRPPDRPRVALVSRPDDAIAAGLSQKLLESSVILAERTDEAQAQRGLARAKYAIIADLRGSETVYHYDAMRADARLARALTDAELQHAAGRLDVRQATDVMQSVPGTRYIDFLIPGLIGMNVMGSSVWGIGYSLVVARKRKLLRRFAVTAMRRGDFLLSYFLARAVFLVLELALLVAFGALAFGTWVQGSYPALALVALAGAAAFAGLGLMVGARVDNTEVAQGWMNFIQLPMWVLSGAFFSNERFPEWLQPFIHALPLTALVGAMRLIYNEGAQLTRIVPDLAILGAWTITGFVIAARTFRWQ
jgi:ABC-2 type transport system permease protein